MDGNSVGTGFFISDKGEILTCFHVIFNENLKFENNKIKSKFQIVKDDSILINVSIPSFYYKSEKGSKYAKRYDFCLLQIESPKDVKDISYFILGNFSDVHEGDVIISCGYPYKSEVPFISSGLFSTKYNESNDEIEGNDTVKYTRDVGLLDLTLNPGNSGGPIIILGDSYKNDKVVGLASYILNPFAKDALIIMKHALNAQKSVKMSYNGINQLDINAILSQAIAYNSIGISGCISIDYFNKIRF